MIITLREKCPYSEFYWSVFSPIWTEYEEIQSISPHLVQMREIRTRKNPNMYSFYAVYTSVKSKISEAYLEPNRMTMIELFCKNS